VIAAAPVKLLLVEDDRIVRITVRDALEDAGFRVTAFDDGLAALRAAEAEPFDLVLTDVRLPGLDGISLFRRLRERQPDVAVVFMTAYAHTDDAVTVMRLGARDYVSKPFEIAELLARLVRVRSEVEFRRGMEAGRASSEPQPKLRITGTSAAVRRLVESIEAAAASDVAVLISGETGTGKDLCARSIHERGRRARKPFVAVNCAAIPETLFESELFGHERGAFTGADKRRVGRFETANGGTLFLDEIGDISLVNQAKLLRAIETSAFEPLGSSRSVKVDVRIIAATNRDLLGDVASGRFRKDLYYRLNVIDLAAPALRDRRGDIPLLVSELLAEIATRQARPTPRLEPDAMAALTSYDYPGNVRELRHALERAVAMARGDELRLEHLPAAFSASFEAVPPLSEADASLQLPEAMRQFELQYIRRVLAMVGGHRGRAAALLGISRKSLWQRLRDEPEGDQGSG
jgi:DNA-binding NtrC family response regulator